MHTCTFSSGCGRFVISESELPERDGFVHFVTAMRTGQAVTTITEFRYCFDKPVRAWSLAHPRSSFPEVLQLELAHMDGLARHQPLFAGQSMPEHAFKRFFLYRRCIGTLRGWSMTLGRG